MPYCSFLLKVPCHCIFYQRCKKFTFNFKNGYISAKTNLTIIEKTKLTIIKKNSIPNNCVALSLSFATQSYIFDRFLATTIK